MSRLLLLLFFVVSFVTSRAQEKIPLDHSVYDGWRDITVRSLTPDGKHAVFLFTPQEGDATLVVRELKTGKLDSLVRIADPAMSYDGAVVAFRIKPAVAQVKELRRQKKKKEELPRDTLGIRSFNGGTLIKHPDVKAFKMPAKAGGWIAFTQEPPRENKQDPKGKKKSRKNSEENGYTLTLLNTTRASQHTFPFVKDFQFAKNGQALVFISTGNDSTMKAGVYRHDLLSGTTAALAEGKVKYKFKGLAVTENGDQVSFLTDTDTTKALVRHWKLYHWKTGNAAASEILVEGNPAAATGQLTSEHYTPVFSKDGSKLFFGVAPAPLVQDTTLLPEEIVQVEVWHTEDAFIYPQQKVQLDNERKRSFLAVADLTMATTPIRVIATADRPTAETGNEGNAPVVLLSSTVPYRKNSSWDLRMPVDAWIVSLTDGAQKKFLEKIPASPRLSPGANYAFWFNPADTSWYTYAVADGKTTRLNAGLRVSFADEEDDHPDFPEAYGMAGWTTDDARVLIHDRYDLWSFDPRGASPAVRLTNGRAVKMVHRFVKTDLESRFIDSASDLWVSYFNEHDKQSGYATVSVKTGKSTLAVYGPARHGGLYKARQSQQYLFTRETFREFPDLWTAGKGLIKPTKVTNVNPQWARYRWGSAEPVSWTGQGGKTIRGVLHKPDGFDATKKYPLLVTFYERGSDDLYEHSAPFPHRSTINKTMYVSNGYLVFEPDVHYRIGYPGESALECITTGVQSLVDKGFVDEKRIGIQGHSWGGYQTAYLVTRTNMFRAAEAGAIVANMVSAYGGIRWETGYSRMFQYEKTQSRIGATLWEKPALYLENSPIFTADRINTPLLLLHNDSDGAVPWYQGIEMYMAMRRLGKPAWMLNYNGEPHWPLKRENRIDFQMRMMQFFDHYLKDAPAPKWMTEGVPAIQKGIVKGY
ncbi:MAG: alpha/beta hydrolase family protein [Bacteroidota bacterium]